MVRNRWSRKSFAFTPRHAFTIVGVLLLAACETTPAGSSPVQAEPQALEKGGQNGAQNAAELQTAELMVEGTNCASCAVSIRRHLHKLQGIGEIREGSTKQHLLVDFDPKLVTTEQLVAAVTEAGYEAQVWVHGLGATEARATEARTQGG